jgi:hypothetical protein
MIKPLSEIWEGLFGLPGNLKTVGPGHCACPQTIFHMTDNEIAMSQSTLPIGSSQ